MDGFDENGIPLDSEHPREPRGTFWVIDLFFRPRTFFKVFATESNPALTLVCAWFFGMSRVIDRYGSRELPVSDEWLYFWLLIAVAGLFGGAIFLGIGGWWFRLRLGFAGAPRPKFEPALRIYIFSSQVIALPTIFVTTFNTIFYASPGAADAAGGSYWWLIMLIFPFWSSLVSTIGVWTLFEVRRGLAAFWFLILPWGFYLLVYGIYLSAFFSAIEEDIHPRTFDPQKFESGTLSFSYPSNWFVDENDANYDPDSHVIVESTNADALVKIQVYESESTIEAELDATVESYGKQFSKLQVDSAETTTGPYRGLCRYGTGIAAGNVYYLRFFICRLESGAYLETQELSIFEEETVLRRGFDLIYSTLRVE